MKMSTIKLIPVEVANKGKPFALFLTTMLAVTTVADCPSPWLSRAPNFTCDVEWSETGEVKGGRVAEYFKYHPIPKSSAYQEITWLKRPPKNLVKVNKDTGDEYICLEGTNVDTVPSLDYSFRITFFEVRVDFSKIAKVYPYDRSRREYKFYTRKIEESGRNSSGRPETWTDQNIPWVRDRKSVV